MSVVLPPFIAHFATLAGDYDVALCDVWGVVHNGVVAAPEACDALTRFRERGGTVVLITNAPRPGERVARGILDLLGVPRVAYDGIVSSGDVTRALIAARAGACVFHIGPERDLPLFDGLAASMAPLERADYVVCSGLLDDTVETPRDYEDLVARMRARTLPMICANPDVVVERGDKLVYCAGSPISTPPRAARWSTRASLIARSTSRRWVLPRPRAGNTWSTIACWRSAIRCAPISRARRRSA
jgi:HAD superfamily hydrolase (TIGR01459 family)